MHPQDCESTQVVELPFWFCGHLRTRNHKAISWFWVFILLFTMVFIRRDREIRNNYSSKFGSRLNLIASASVPLPITTPCTTINLRQTQSCVNWAARRPVTRCPQPSKNSRTLWHKHIGSEHHSAGTICRFRGCGEPLNNLVLCMQSVTPYLVIRPCSDLR